MGWVLVLLVVDGRQLLAPPPDCLEGSANPGGGMGAERGSRVSQLALSPCCPRVRATENAPRNTFRVLERRHSLVEIVQRGVGVFVERPCVITPHCERAIIILSENASCHGHRFAEQWLGLFEAL